MPSLTYVTITATFTDGSNEPVARGVATFTPSAPVFEAGSPVATPNNPVQAQIVNGQLLGSDGQSPLTLLATDNDGLTVGGMSGFWFWTVQVQINNVRQDPWIFVLPSSPDSVDLYSLANTGGGGGVGFANPMTTLGDIIAGGAAGAPARVAGNTSATRKFLRELGDGTNAAAPVWDTLQTGDIPAGLPYDAAGAAAAAQTAAEAYTDSSVAVVKNRAVYLADNGIHPGGSNLGPAITALLQNAMASAIAGSTYCVDVVGEPGVYDLGTAGQHYASSVQGGNALILPSWVDPAVVQQKVIVQLRGAVDGAALTYWTQLGPQKAGTVFTTSANPTVPDPTWGPLSMVGGPTNLGSGSFSNVLMVVDGIALVPPWNSGILGFDFWQCAQARMKSGSYIANAVPGGSPNLASKPTNGLSIGLRMPALGNNDQSLVESWSCEGAAVGLAHGDHCTVVRAALIYCDTGVFIYTSGTREHGASYLNLSIEASNTAIQSSDPGDPGSFPVTIQQLNIESVPTTISDSGNKLVGEIRFQNNSGAAPVVSGAARIKIVDLSLDPGAFTAALPASGSPSTPSFRDTFYSISAALTGVTVDGKALGAVSQFFVPSGKVYTPTYGGSPTAVGFRS